jgi:soluble lytic murein transglycosylase
VRGLTTTRLLQAAEYARRYGLYDRANQHAERSRRAPRLRLALHDAVSAASSLRRPAIRASTKSFSTEIARQESRFVPVHRVVGGRMGLMQLMPGTARWVAQAAGAQRFPAAHVTKVDLNTQFGALLFQVLAGSPRRPAARSRLPPIMRDRPCARRASSRTPLEGAIWVETIPFNETRDYVKKVLAKRHDLHARAQTAVRGALRAARHIRRRRERRQRGTAHGSRAQAE